MAKINKYWGLVVLGAATAAAAGAVAAVFSKRRVLEQTADLEEDFEDEQEPSLQPEKKDVHEDFISWEDTSDEDVSDLPEEETSEEDAADVPEEDASEGTGEDAEDKSVDSALEEAEKVADEFEEELAEANQEQDKEEASIHID